MSKKKWKYPNRRLRERIVIKMSREGKLGEFIILEFKRMSDVTENYLTWVKDKGEGRYESSKSVLERSIGPQGWR